MADATGSASSSLAAAFLTLVMLLCTAASAQGSALHGAPTPAEVAPPTVLAQSKLPADLRLSGPPVVRPGRVRPPTESEEHLQLEATQETIPLKEPKRPPQLLPAQEPEPNTVYIIPFKGVMVPAVVLDQAFDLFVDTLNHKGQALGLEFIILKEPKERIDAAWLNTRRHITGEIYAYLEDSGCCTTDVRSKARIAYHRPPHRTPAFGFAAPASVFFDHDQSTLAIERNKLAETIATLLADEILKALRS